MLVLLGGLIGFLPYNFNPAKTFMGDSGSNFLGFTLSTIAMLGMAKAYTFMSVVLPVIILGLPIFDTLFAIVRRVLNHKPIMQADRGHLHHKLMDAGLSQKQVVVILYAICLILFAKTPKSAFLSKSNIAALTTPGPETPIFKAHSGSP